jgi:hypothetical protein
MIKYGDLLLSKARTSLSQDDHACMQHRVESTSKCFFSSKDETCLMEDACIAVDHLLSSSAKIIYFIVHHYNDLKMINGLH